MIFFSFPSRADVEDMDLSSVFDHEMIEDDVIPALEMAMYVFRVSNLFLWPSMHSQSNLINPNPS